MNKHIPALLMAIIITVLAIKLYQSNREIADLEDRIAELERSPMSRIAKGSRPAMSRRHQDSGSLPRSSMRAGAQPAEEPAGDGEGVEPAARRMMSNLSKMLENPTMNKMMVAGQRGALEALYGDLIQSFELSGEEKDYFMDLLMSRQMKQFDLGMKMMGGGVSEEEKKKMGEEVMQVSETVKAEMEKFLNSADDYAEFEFHEKTMGERMMLSQMTQKLEGTDAPLSTETHRELLEMMHDERQNFPFNTNLYDSENNDMSAEHFSKQNVQQFSDDMDRLNRSMVEKAKDLLTAEQLSAFKESVEATAKMQKSQMEMAAQMLSGGEKGE